MLKSIVNHSLIWGLVFLIPLLSSGQEIRLSLIAESNVQAPSTYEKKFFVNRGDQVVSSYFNPKIQSITFESTSSDPLKLPLQLDVLVSDDGQTIVQYGDQVTLFHPTNTDLFWLDQQGNIINQVVNEFQNYAVVRMSADGYVGVAGQSFGKRERVIKLYNPQGGEMWSRPQEEGRRITEMKIGNKGNQVAIITTDGDNWLEDHRLELLDRNGRVKAAVAEQGIMQKIGLVGTGEDIFVQGYDRYYLVDATSGQVKWSRNETVRMVSPEGAVQSIGNQNIFLAIVDWNGKPNDTYTWVVRTLDYNNGADSGRFVLPEKHASTWNKVFKSISPDQLTIETANKKYDLKIN